MALLVAEEYCSTELVCWLDSDLLIVNEPNQLILADDEALSACAVNKEQGSSGPDDPYDTIWRHICDVTGIPIDSLPWVVTEYEQIPIRLYWNGGIFLYRSSTGLAKKYFEIYTKLMDAKKISSLSGYSLSINEMGAIGLAVLDLKLKWRALPITHNLSLRDCTDPKYYQKSLKSASILHYHDFMWPKSWNQFLQIITESHPQVAEWLAKLGPMKNTAPFANRLAAKGFRIWRDRQEKAYLKKCSLI
jgi:lipopolysaccharide biosynthesis glycosyltransferase